MTGDEGFENCDDSLIIDVAVMTVGCGETASRSITFLST